MRDVQRLPGLLADGACDLPEDTVFATSVCGSAGLLGAEAGEHPGGLIERDVLPDVLGAARLGLVVRQGRLLIDHHGQIRNVEGRLGRVSFDEARFPGIHNGVGSP